MESKTADKGGLLNSGSFNKGKWWSPLEAVPWVNWVPLQTLVIALQMLPLLLWPAGGAMSQAPAPRTGRLWALLSILGQLGAEYGVAPLLCQAPLQKQGAPVVIREGRGKPENLSVGSPSSEETSEPKGWGAGRGKQGEKKGSCALRVKTLPPLWWDRWGYPGKESCSKPSQP